MDTLHQLQRARERHPAPPPAGSQQEADALRRFTEFFADFSPDRIERLLAPTYADDVYFNDTLKAVHGSSHLAHYLEQSARAVEDCRVLIEDTVRTIHGEYLVRWRMKIRFRRFRRGVDTWSVGISHLRFDAEGRVVYQQDYWNAAEGLFEHLPIIGSVIRWIRRRL